MVDPIPDPAVAPLAELYRLAARSDGAAAADLARAWAHLLRSELTVVRARAQLARARVATCSANGRLVADLAAIEAAAVALAAQVDAAVAAAPPAAGGGAGRQPRA
jgi:hypothetical protein